MENVEDGFSYYIQRDYIDDILDTYGYE